MKPKQKFVIAAVLLVAAACSVAARPNADPAAGTTGESSWLSLLRRT